jgi:hypothetical protein
MISFEYVGWFASPLGILSGYVLVQLMEYFGRAVGIVKSVKVLNVLPCPARR